VTGPVDPEITWQEAGPPPATRPTALPALVLTAGGFVAVVLLRRGEVFD
jgi:hypothetical protein